MQGFRRLFKFFPRTRIDDTPLILIGALAQGCRSPLEHAKTKCSLWSSSLSLRHGEMLTTIYASWGRSLTTSLGDHCTTIATKPSWWCWSLRLIIKKLSLNSNKNNENNGCTLITLLFTNEVTNLHNLTWDDPRGLFFQVSWGGRGPVGLYY